jgi:hypothetical protein
MVQSLYDSLELKDSEIYCKRAKEMYSSAEPLRTGLFVFSMKDTRLLAMFDPTMLGEENLINNLKDIDKIRYSRTLDLSMGIAFKSGQIASPVIVGVDPVLYMYYHIVHTLMCKFVDLRAYVHV